MTSSPRRWYERVVTAAMVLVGFAAGSVGLSMLAEVGAEDPVLTDEFRLEEGEDGTITAVALTSTTTTTTSTTTTTAPPEPAVETEVDEDDDDRDGDRRRGDRSERGPRGGRPPQA